MSIKIISVTKNYLNILQETATKAFYNVFKNDITLIDDFLYNFDDTIDYPHSSRLKDWVEYYNQFL